MKRNFLCIALIGCTGWVYGQISAQPSAGDFDKLKWLEGMWIRTNSKPGRSGVEQWKKISATEWHGTGATLQGKDTAFVERLKLITKSGSIYYVADVPENKEPVYFKFTEISSAHFVCENPEHDFPKKIVYRKEGAFVKATISGDGKSVEYLFERKK